MQYAAKCRYALGLDANMTRLPARSLAVLLCCAAAACDSSGDSADAPPKRMIHVENRSSTEANVRIKFWDKDFTRVSVGKDESIVVRGDSDTVQVEARSRKWNDDCWVTMQVNQTLVVRDGTERIDCAVE